MMMFAYIEFVILFWFFEIEIFEKFQQKYFCEFCLKTSLNLIISNMLSMSDHLWCHHSV